MRRGHTSCAHAARRGHYEGAAHRGARKREGPLEGANAVLGRLRARDHAHARPRIDAHAERCGVERVHAQRDLQRAVWQARQVDAAAEAAVHQWVTEEAEQSVRLVEHGFERVVVLVLVLVAEEYVGCTHSEQHAAVELLEGVDRHEWTCEEQCARMGHMQCRPPKDRGAGDREWTVIAVTDRGGEGRCEKSEQHRRKHARCVCVRQAKRLLFGFVETSVLAWWRQRGRIPEPTYT